jgi:PAS domain S-box-containing protein
MPASSDVLSSLRQAAEATGAAHGRVVQLRTVFDQSLIPMILVDNERRYKEVNAAARLLARISLEEVRRLRIDDFTADEDRAVLEAAWAKLMAHGTVNGRYHASFPDGSSIWLLYSGAANALPGQHLVVFIPADWPDGEIEELHPAGDERAPAFLSRRQLDVLRLVAVGANGGQIATELSISEATVRTHVKNILDRLGAHNRAHAVALAMTQGLLGEA